MITALEEAEEQNKRLTDEAYRLKVLSNKLHAENKRLNDLLNQRNPFNSDVEEQQIDAKAALQEQMVRNDKLVATLREAGKALLDFEQRLKAKDEELRSIKTKFIEIQGAPGSKRFQDDLTAQLRLKHDRITAISSELESTQRLLSESEGKARKLQQDLVGLCCKVKLAMLPIPDEENGTNNKLQVLLDEKDKMLDEMQKDNEQLTEICENLKVKFEQEGHNKNILNTKVQLLETELARLRAPQPTTPSNYPGFYNGYFQQHQLQRMPMPNNMPPPNQSMFHPPPMHYHYQPPIMMQPDTTQPPPAPAHDMSLMMKNMQMQIDQLTQKQNGLDQKQ